MLFIWNIAIPHPKPQHTMIVQKLATQLISIHSTTQKHSHNQIKHMSDTVDNHNNNNDNINKNKIDINEHSEVINTK